MLLSFSITQTDFAYILAVLSMAFLAVVFLQSGIDKLTDWKGNLSWLTGHFGKTFLHSLVKPLLAVLALLEIVSGLGAVASIAGLLVLHSTATAYWTLCLSLFTFLCLFAGQRIAKDYAGASTIIIYVAFTLITAYLWLTI